METHVGRCALLLPLLFGPAHADAPVPAGTVPRVTLHRFEVGPAACAPGGAPFGPLGVEGYLVVIAIEPDRRFVSARAEVRDGFFCLPARQLPRLGRLAGRVGAGLLVSELPAGLGEGLRLVSELALAARAQPRARHRATRFVRLPADAVEHNAGYVAGLLLVAAGPMTRLAITRIATRPVGHRGGRRTTDAEPVGAEDPPLPRERVKTILLGGPDRNFGP